MKPLISICVPTCNRKKFLKMMLECFEKQISILPSAEMIEIVISDNHSSDGTEELLRAAAERVPGLRYVRQEKNFGAIHNIFKVLELAQGEFVWFFSDDDLPVDGAVEKVLNVLQSNTAICYLTMDINTVSENGEIEKKVFLPKQLQDRYFTAYAYLHSYLYVSGFLSINVFRREPLLEILRDRSILGFAQSVGWPQLVLAAFVVKQSGGTYVIADPLVNKRAGNLIFGPQEIINAYWADPLRIVTFLRQHAVPGIRADANYSYMFNWPSFICLFCWYTFTNPLLKINYLKEIFALWWLTRNWKAKAKIVFFALAFCVSARFYHLAMHWAFLFFRKEAKYLSLEKLYLQLADKYLLYRGGKLSPEIKTFCKNV